MSLRQWAANRWLQEEPTSPHEIKNLLAIARDLQDAAGDISADWRFGIAYNAALWSAGLLKEMALSFNKLLWN